MNDAGAFSFCASTHTYTVAGAVVPSVTQIIAPIAAIEFANVPPAVLQRKREIGTAVHLACEYLDRGELDEASIDPIIAPYITAYRRFLAERAPRWTALEHPRYHKLLGYAGMLDREGWIGDTFYTVDIKTTAAVYPHVGVQLAAYHELARVNGRHDGIPARRLARAALQLRQDGTYRFVPFGSPLDLPAFHGLLAVHKWSRHHHGH